MYTADLHCDTISKIWHAKLRGENASLKNSDELAQPLHIDLGKLKAGQYVLQNFALFANMHMPASLLQGCRSDFSSQMPGAAMAAISENGGEEYVDPWYQAKEMIRVFREEIDANKDLIRQVRNWNDIEKNQQDGIISAVLTTEEGGIIQGDISRLDTLYDAGVRMMTVTWNFDNELGHPNHQPSGVKEDFRNFYRFTPEKNMGLTDTGKEAVKRMEELGIIPDVSHLSDEGFFDVADVLNGPFAASHSNARAICGCSRNLTDEMIRVIADHGGVIGLNFCPSFVVETDDENLCYTSCEGLMRHARHIMNIGGRDVIALGTDFDGIPHNNLEIDNAGQIQKLAEYALKNGFSRAEAEGMFYKNVLRLYREVL